MSCASVKKKCLEIQPIRGDITNEKMLMGASGMFSEAHIDGFQAIVHKRVASLVQRMRGSSNSPLSTVAQRVVGRH